MIVPVWISSPSTSTSETLVYALQDTPCSHTFTDQEVYRELQAKMEPVKLSLSTLLGRNSAIQSNRVDGLSVRVFSIDVCVDLPPPYTGEFILLERSHIPTSKTATKWKHLAIITQEIPSLMNCSVGLLIGYDCSRVLVPRKVITEADQDPYAIKTDRRWGIVGNVTDCVNSNVTSLCQRISVNELPSVTLLTCNRAFEADFADSGPGRKSISQDDIQFLNILKPNTHTNECGHIEMPLPFKVRSTISDNRRLPIIRLK